jgi:hypothetical protein
MLERDLEIARRGRQIVAAAGLIALSHLRHYDALVLRTCIGSPLVFVAANSLSFLIDIPVRVFFPARARASSLPKNLC